MAEIKPWPSLDMWTEIVAVHWGDRPITKLDFVHDRYMVVGRDQQRAEVINPPEYRLGPDGLDLRGYSGGVPTLAADPRRARLRNKVFPITRESPGALNEFSFLDYTIVMEFDWEDRRGWKEANEGYAFVDGSSFPWFRFETILSGYQSSPGLDVNFFDVVQGAETKSYPEQPFELLVSDEDYFEWIPETLGGWEGGFYVTTEPHEGIAWSLEHDRFGTPHYVRFWNPDEDVGDPWFQWRLIGESKYNFWIMTGDKPPFGTILDGPTAEREDQGAYIGAAINDSDGNVFLTGSPGLWYSRSGPPWDGNAVPSLVPPSSQWSPARIYEAGVMAATLPTVNAYTTPTDTYGADDTLTNARLMPGTTYEPDVHRGPIGGIPAPYGVNRMAINVNADSMSISVNGEDVVTVEAPAGFPIPRVPTEPETPIDQQRKGFPAFADATGNWFEFWFQFSGHVRCVWLYRKTKKPERLKELSVVRELPPADSPEWKTR